MTPTSYRRSRRRRSLGRAALGACLLLVLAVAGCGIPRDSEPREVSVDNDLLGPTSTVSVPSGTADVPVYFPVENDHLERVTVKAETSADPMLALQILMNGPTQEQREQLKVSTSIPNGTGVIGATQEGDVLTIDLTSGILVLEGRNLTTAYAQMVFTATAVDTDPPITRVRFTVEGKEILAPSDEGQLRVVEKKNYTGPNTPDG